MTPRSYLAWSWTLVMLALCWVPREYLPEKEKTPSSFFIPNFDKLVHLGIFALWGFLWMRVGRSTGRGRWVFLGGLMLAIISELGQELPIIRRDASVQDGLADVIGVVIGISTFYLARKFAEKGGVRPEL